MYKHLQLRKSATKLHKNFKWGNNETKKDICFLMPSSVECGFTLFH